MTQSTAELVEAMRAVIRVEKDDAGRIIGAYASGLLEPARLLEEAATALEAQQAQIKRLAEALRPLALIADNYDDEEDDAFQVWQDFDILGASLPLRNFRRARSALNEVTGE